MILIRHAEVNDLPELAEIRNYYILNSHALFDTKTETAEERLPWFQRYRKSGPHRLLVAVEDGKVTGYASSSKYRDGDYFSTSVEVSIYVAPGFGSKGIGSRLYEELLSLIKQENIHCVLAGIALPNEASIRLHEKFGFKKVGVFSEYAIKNGKFLSSLWMQQDPRTMIE